MGEVIYLRGEVTFGDIQDADFTLDGGAADEFFKVPHGEFFVVDGQIWLVEGPGPPVGKPGWHK